jgi:DNA-binding protein Fis
MKPVHFLSNSPQIDSIVKGFTLTKSLFVSSILIGEAHTGKKTLIKTLCPQAIYVDGANYDALQQALENNNEIIIYNFHKVANFELLKFEHRRIIAITDYVENSLKIDKKFAFIYRMPNIQEREDKEQLIEYFQKKIQDRLLLEKEIEIDPEKLDFSNNIKSLCASLHKELLIKTYKKKDIEEILFHYIHDKLEGNNAYRELLPLFEKPLILAGLDKFKSQLKLSSILGLNRNTLRKKMQENELD